jgi:hypothetical protein
MTDLVERLRLPGKATRELQDEAAAEIERLNQQLRAVLKYVEELRGRSKTHET